MKKLTDERTLEKRNELKKLMTMNHGTQLIELVKMGYRLHHSANRPGYTKQGTVEVEDYNGNFGDGFRVLIGNRVAYFIKEIAPLEKCTTFPDCNFDDCTTCINEDCILHD